MNLYRDMYKHLKTFPNAFWVVIIATLINQIGNMAFVFLVLYLTKALGFSLSQSALAFAILSGSMLITGLFGGSVVDKFGASRVMIISLLINGCLLLSFPYFHSFIAIVILCIGWGAAFGLYRPASQTFVSYLSSAGTHKVTFSVYRLATNLGMSIGPAIGGYLATHSFAIIFTGNGIANLLACTILILGLLGSSWHQHRPGAQRKIEINLKCLWEESFLLIFMLGMLPVSMVFFQHESTLAVFLNENLNIPVSFYGLLFTINTLVIVFFELPLNMATINWPYRINFMLGSGLIAFGFAGLAFVSFRWQVVLLTLFWTLGEMILYPACSSYIAEIAPEEKRGTYMSLFNTCSNLGMLLGPWSGAMVMEYFGGRGLWVVCGVWGMISVVIFNFIREP